MAKSSSNEISFLKADHFESAASVECSEKWVCGPVSCGPTFHLEEP